VLAPEKRRRDDLSRPSWIPRHRGDEEATIFVIRRDLSGERVSRSHPTRSIDVCPAELRALSQRRLVTHAVKSEDETAGRLQEALVSPGSTVAEELLLSAAASGNVGLVQMETNPPNLKSLATTSTLTDR
jgi:hypothetical protein